MQIDADLRKWQDQRLEADRRFHQEQKAAAEKREDDRREADRQRQEKQRLEDLDRQTRQWRWDKGITIGLAILMFMLGVLFRDSLVPRSENERKSEKKAEPGK